ncbi:hypothetical protein IA854_13905 [Listeria seeligeri]|uniref:hypothetical protein n=1 Tax=Listeria seeligeri TaxID=1640 RepID=UPI001887263A|nr:hypothetical protein [Listeria seeligeri]MBF2375237.1 hypothetical protein [Listeria seeligeri]
MELKDYKELPDRIPEEDIYNFIESTISDYNSNRITKNAFLEIMTELMERQIMTYKILKEPLRGVLDEVITKIWNTNNYNDVDMMLSLIVNFGLEKSFNEAKQSIENKSNIESDILNEIQETVSEVGDHISNPYHGLQ